MKYTFATIAAFASVALAKPAFLNTDFELTEGKPYTIRYSGCDDGCTIVLQNGPSDDLKDYKTLTTSATGDSFTFTPSELPTDTYNFKITDKAGDVNYSAQFPYKGSYAAPSVTSATATKSAETTAVASTKEATTLASVTKSAETTTVAKPIIPTHAPSNATTPTAAHPTPSKTGSAGGQTSVPSVPESGATRMTSSLALIAGAVMAMVYLN
ncbi:extracellular matrix precursor [Fusarium beomiforme]|uniref:Extracellular matrix n=1 Tax=Fusarium beomiforme TaxID=44412 RepID=A0A9P5A8V1_9HYPO|nr:extracellular matrix precursor [Fusarium beomiforme]